MMCVHSVELIPAIPRRCGCRSPTPVLIGVFRDDWRDMDELPSAVMLTVRDAASERVLSVSTVTPVHIDAPARGGKSEELPPEPFSSRLLKNPVFDEIFRCPKGMRNRARVCIGGKAAEFCIFLRHLHRSRQTHPVAAISLGMRTRL